MNHEIFMTATNLKEVNAIGFNIEENGEWIVKIFLDELRVRKNVNVEKFARKIIWLDILELICIMAQIDDFWNEELFCGHFDCKCTEIVKKMGVRNR